MGAKLPEVFVLPAVTVTLHDVLVATITRILVAHESVEGEEEEEVQMKYFMIYCCENPEQEKKVQPQF